MSKNQDSSGQSDGREIEREVETRAGHPTSEHSDDHANESTRLREEMAAEFFGVAPRSHQHSRKGQAESPRELNENQPERKHDKNR